MTNTLRTSPRKRKHSDSPSRKKARTDAGTPAITTPAPTPVQTTATDEELFAAFYRDVLGEDPTPPPLATPTVAQTVPAIAAGPRPANPFAGTVKPLRSNFGTGAHDVAHFQPTRHKVRHGVWRSRTKVKEWVGLALDSIYLDDRYIVDSKRGESGGHNYLISMDGMKVGYLSGSSVPRGTKPPATHIEVYLDNKGNTVSAFPSSPDIF